MKAVSVAESEMLENSSRLFDWNKAGKYIKRFVKSIGKPTGDGGLSKRFTHAVTVKGISCLDTLKHAGRIRYTVADSLSVAPHFMGMLKDALEKEGFTLTVGLVPLGGHVSGIYVHDADICVETGEREEGSKNINMNRFVIRQNEGGVKGKIRLAAKVRESCLSEAVSSLKSAAEHHFTLEEIYKSSMDFEAMFAEIEPLIGQIMLRMKK